MLLIVAGLLISTLSGVITFVWLASSGTNEISAAQDSAYSEEDVMPQADNSLYDDPEDAVRSDYADADQGGALHDSNKEYAAEDAVDESYPGSRDEAEYLPGAYTEDIPFIEDDSEDRSAAEAEMILPEEAEDQANSAPAGQKEHHESAREKAVPTAYKAQEVRHSGETEKAAEHEYPGTAAGLNTSISVLDEARTQKAYSNEQRESLLAMPSHEGVITIPSRPGEDKTAPPDRHEEIRVNDTDSVSPQNPFRESAGSVTAETEVPKLLHSTVAGEGTGSADAQFPSQEKDDLDSAAGGERHQMIQTVSELTETNVNDAKVRTIQNGLSSTLKEMFVNYEDLFNTHMNNWPEYNNSTASALIEDGEYHVEHKSKTGSHTVLHPYGVPAHMDFMITIGISSVLGMGENSYGFIVGAADQDNNYSFQIHNGHSYTIERIRNGEETRLAAGPIDNIFIGNDPLQTLKIVKQGSQLHFYINDFYMAEVSEADFSGDKVGFIVKGRVKISVDWTKTQIRFRNS
ncbi:MAG: hypothetical protein JSU90_05425 [Nitrospiraceae bacterium]|nr:MAG: hypothetical protein JSU90_05425 [Nitrospiraceae bacterium]